MPWVAAGARHSCRRNSALTLVCVGIGVGSRPNRFGSFARRGRNFVRRPCSARRCSPASAPAKPAASEDPQPSRPFHRPVQADELCQRPRDGAAVGTRAYGAAVEDRRGIPRPFHRSQSAHRWPATTGPHKHDSWRTKMTVVSAPKMRPGKASAKTPSRRFMSLMW